MPLTTYNNVSIPSLMYGTAWKKQKTTEMVELAIKCGFTAIDTANQLIHYQEALVGHALMVAMQSKSRDQFFIQTKFTSVNGQDHRTPYDASAPVKAQVYQSFESSLKHLHVNVIDSYVLHGPYSRNGLTDSDWQVWSAMEDLYNQKKTRIIGISNVTSLQLEQLCAGASVKPAVVQNRCYAVTGWDMAVRDICKAEGIIYQGFSLLTANPDVLRSREVQSIAKRLGATPAQVVFRFCMDVGMLPLTGTCSELHMNEDLAAEQLELTAEEVDLIENISVG